MARAASGNLQEKFLKPGCGGSSLWSACLGGAILPGCAWDGGQLVALAAGRELGRATIQSGLAFLQLRDALQNCRVELPDGRTLDLAQR
jgi:hypothetical protein